MLDAAIIARIKEIIGDHRCKCGKPADRFRRVHSKGDMFYCHQCYSQIEAEFEVEARPHKRSTVVRPHIDDPDNMPDLFWAPPVRHGGKRHEAIQQQRSA